MKDDVPTLLSGMRKSNLKAATAQYKPPFVGATFLSRFLSIKVLHELMHCGDCVKRTWRVIADNVRSADNTQSQLSCRKASSRSSTAITLSWRGMKKMVSIYCRRKIKCAMPIAMQWLQEVGHSLIVSRCHFLVLTIILVWYLTYYRSESGALEFNGLKNEYETIPLPHDWKNGEAKLNLEKGI